MKNLIQYFGLALVFVCLGQAGVAQSQDTLKLDFQTAVDMALEKNIDYRTQQNELSRAGANLMQSQFLIAPTVNAGGSLAESRGRQQVQDEETGQVSFENRVTQNVGLGLDINLTLFNGLSNFNSIVSSSFLLKSQSSALERAQQTAIYNVALQYMQCLLSQQLFNIAQDNHRNQLISLQRIEGQVEVNARPLVDKYNQQYQVKNAETLMIQAKNNLENNKSVLAQTIQLSPGQEFKVEIPKGTVSDALNYQVSLQELFEAAIQNRKDLKQREYNSKAAGRSVSVQRGNVIPTVNAFYSYSTNYYSFISYNFSEQLTNVFPSHYYGVRFNIPIFNGMTNASAIQRAKLDYENAKLVEENTKSVIYRDVQQAYNNFVASKASYNAALSQLEAANMAYTLQNERYELGAGTFLDFSQANNTLVQAQAAKAQSEYSLKFQKIILDYQTGQLSSEGIK